MASGTCYWLSLLVYLLVIGSIASPINGQPCSFSSDMNPTTPTVAVIYNITEDWPVNTSLAHLFVEGGENEVELSLENNNYSVELDRTSRNLILRKRIQILSNNGLSDVTWELKITCRKLSSVQQAAVPMLVFIKVWDKNDHRPVFVNAPYAVTVSELEPVGTTVFSSVDARDLDPSDVGYLTFSIDQSTPYASSFSFPVSSVGAITLQRQLNYERVRTINLTIYVKDNSDNHRVLGQVQPQFTATTWLLVTVTSAGDRNPTFSRSTYTAAVDRSTATGTALNVMPHIAAANVNPGTSTLLIFSIVHDAVHDDGKYFEINRTTGQLTTALPFDANTPNVLAFQLKVAEVEQPRRYGSCLVKVKVVGERSETTLAPPVFRQAVYNVTLVEGIPVGSLVAALSVQSSCSPSVNITSRFRFSFVNDPQNPHTDFVIDSETGEIRTAKPLRYDPTPRYTLQVKVTDGSSTSFATVLINILPQPFSNPQFSSHFYLFNVTRTADVIGQVQATSGNPESRISYRLLENPLHQSLFSIDDEGQIRVSSDLERSPFNSYTLTVVAVDDRVPSRQDAALAVVSLTPLVTTTGPVQTGQPDYRTAIIVIGIICGILGLLLVIVFAVLVCVHRKASRACSEVRSVCCGTVSPHSPRAERNVYERTFQSTSDYGPYLPYETESTTDSLRMPHRPVKELADGRLQFVGGHSPMSSTAGKDADRTGLDGSFDGSEQLATIYGSKSIDRSAGAGYKATAAAPLRMGLYARGRQAELATLPQRTLYGEPAAVGMDPGAISSTETLMGPPGSSARRTGVSFADSLQGVNGYLSSPEGSQLSVGTQLRHEEAPGITVYY